MPPLVDQVALPLQRTLLTCLILHLKACCGLGQDFVAVPAVTCKEIYIETLP